MYSWSKFGREAENVVALYLKSMGWDIALSPASSGPADIVATYDCSKWFIQVKASAGIPRLRGYEVKRLKELAESKNGLPMVSTLQPFPDGFSTGNYSILFYAFDSWRELDPMEFLECGDRIASRSSTRSHLMRYLNSPSCLLHKYRIISNPSNSVLKPFSTFP